MGSWVSVRGWCLSGVVYHSLVLTIDLKVGMISPSSWRVLLSSSTKTFTLLDNPLGWPRVKQQDPSPTKPSNCDDHQPFISPDMDW